MCLSIEEVGVHEAGEQHSRAESLREVVVHRATREAGQLDAVAFPLPVEQVRSALVRAGRLDIADGRHILLEKPVISLGRNLDNDIIIEDKRVSRHHAQIRFVQGAFFLYDLASANGTMVNNQPIEQVTLRDGDVISLGGVAASFHNQGRALATQEHASGA